MNACRHVSKKLTGLLCLLWLSLGNSPAQELAAVTPAPEATQQKETLHPLKEVLEDLKFRKGIYLIYNAEGVFDFVCHIL